MPDETTTKFKGDVSDLLAAVAEAKAAMASFSDTVKKTTTETSKSTKGAGKDFDDFAKLLGRDLKQGETSTDLFNQKANELTNRIKTLKKEISSGSGNTTSLFGDLKKTQGDLSKVEGYLKDIGGESGNIFTKFGQAKDEAAGLVPLLIQMGVAASPFLVPLAAGSLLGVLGAGGLALGIAGQLHNADVKSAIGALGADVKSSLHDSTAAFGPELTKSINIADQGVTGFINDLKPAENALAPILTVFTKKVTGGLLTAGPIFADAMARSKPDVAALGGLIGDLTVGTAKFFDGLAIGADGGAAAIKALGVELKNLLGDLGTDLGIISQMTGEINSLEQGVEKAGPSTGILGKALTGLKQAAKDAIDPLANIEDINGAIGRAFNQSSTSADKFDGSVNSLGVDTRNMAPAVAGATSRVDYLGIAALNAGVPLATTGQAVQSLGEHSGASNPAVLAIGQSVQSMGEHAGTSNLATQALGFSVQSLGEHSGASSPAVMAVGQSVQSMGEHAGTSNLATQALGQSVKSMGEHSGAAIGQLNGADQAISNTTPDAQALAGALNDMATAMDKAESAALTLDQANLNLKQATADLGSTLKKNKDNWDQNTQAGRDDWSQLLTTLGAIQKVHDAQVASGGATEKNTAAYYKNVDSLLSLARQAGLSKKDLAALKRQFEELPTSKTFTVKVRVTGSLAGVAALTGQRTVSANSDTRIAGVAQFANSGTFAGPSYADSGSTGFYAGRKGGLYRFAEASTGVEALISRNGDPGRGLAVTAQAARWFGGHIAPGRSMASGMDYSSSGGGGGVGPVLLHSIIQIDGKTVVDAITPAAQRRGHRNAGTTGLG